MPPEYLVPMGQAHAGLTVHDVARRYRVSPDKVRIWVNAANYAPSTLRLPCAAGPAGSCRRRPRGVRAEAGGRAAAQAAATKKQRCQVDYYPDRGWLSESQDAEGRTFTAGGQGRTHRYLSTPEP